MSSSPPPAKRARKASPKKAAADADAAPRPPREMNPRGHSADWERSKANILKHGDRFLENIAKTEAALASRWGRKWVEVPEAEARQQEIYGHAATFIAEDQIEAGKKNAGKGVCVGTALGLWRGLVNERRLHFRNSKDEATIVRACARARSPFARLRPL